MKKADGIKKVMPWRKIPIGIEVEPGDIRFKGKPWEMKMQCSYGHIRGSYGDADDGMAHDVYIGPDLGSDRIFKISQLVPETGEFDEFKYMIGFDSAKEAEDMYLKHMRKKAFGGIKAVPFSELKSYQKLQKYAVAGFLYTFQNGALIKVPCGRSYIPKTKKCTKGRAAETPKERLQAFANKERSRKGLTPKKFDPYEPLPPEDEPAELEQSSATESAIATASPSGKSDRGHSPDLPENHVISKDSRVTSAQIDKALRELEDDSNRGNLAKFRRFVELNGVRAICHHQGKILSSDEGKQLQGELGIKGRSIADSRVKPPNLGVFGYTNRTVNHIVFCLTGEGAFSPDADQLKQDISSILDHVVQGGKVPDSIFTGDKFSFEKTFPHSNSALGTYLHEMGHQIHFAKYDRSILDAPAGWKSFSIYGDSTDTEWAAEHFVAWALVPEQYKAAVPLGYAWIDKMVAESLKKRRLP